MSPGGHPAESPGHDDTGTFAGQMPERHPDKLTQPEPTFPTVRRNWPLTHRHYDALVDKIDRNTTRLEEDHERDFADLWNLISEIAENPDSSALRTVLDELRKLSQQVAALDEKVTRVMRVLHVGTSEMAEVTGELLDDT